MSTPIAELRRVSKRFGSTAALCEVSLAFRAGEVHVLAGENGAGKSTLLRVLAGVYRDFEGELVMEGSAVRLSGPADARRRGVATIHQELSLVGSMSVADNLHLGEAGSALGWLPGRARRGRAQRMLEAVGLGDLDPGRAVEELPLAVRQLIEIARALAQRARLFIMDEPTSTLAAAEVERLLARIAALRAEGKAMVFISHRLDEIERIADRVTVLRDGRVVTSRPAAELDRGELIEAMIGRRAEAVQAGAAVARERAVVLEAVGLAARRPGRSAERVLDGVSLELGRGEIVGVAGLLGSGAAELPDALFGTLPLEAGTLRIGGRAHRPTPARAVAAGMLLLSGDRRRALVAHASVRDNAALASLRRFSRGGWMDDGELARAVARLAEALDLAAPSLEAPVATLSGGNQQKVALMRCLLAQPKILLLDDATRGVDVGARRDVHRQLRELAARGVALLVSSSDSEELASLCDRVLVLARGRIAGVLSGRELAQEAIVRAAMSEVA